MKIETGIVRCFGSLIDQKKTRSEPASGYLTTRRFFSVATWQNAIAPEAKNKPIFLAGGKYPHGRFVYLHQQGDRPLCHLLIRLVQGCRMKTIDSAFTPVD